MRDVVVVVVCLVRGDELFVCVCLCVCVCVWSFSPSVPSEIPVAPKKDMKTIGRIPFLGCFAHATCNDLVRLSISRFHLSSFGTKIKFALSLSHYVFVPPDADGENGVVSKTTMTATNRDLRRSVCMSFVLLLFFQSTSLLLAWMVHTVYTAMEYTTYRHLIVGNARWLAVVD